jgi:hypothetical protein
MFETKCRCTNPLMETATAAVGILQPSPPSTAIAHRFPAIHKNPVQFQVTTLYIIIIMAGTGKESNLADLPPFLNPTNHEKLSIGARGNCRGKGSRDLSVPQFPRTTTPSPQSSRNDATTFQFKLHINCFRRFLSIRAIADPVVN